MPTIQRILSVLLALLLLAACSPTVPAPTTGPQQAPTPVPPSAKVEPTPQPTTNPTATPLAIVLESPQAGDKVSSPVEVRGSVAVVPFESTLRGRVLDGSGNVIGEGPIMVQGSMGDPGPAPFSGEIAFTVSAAGPGKVEVADLSPKDGAVLSSATVDVLLTPSGTAAGTIEIPAADVQATLPLHILARVGQPGQQVVAALLWQDGSVLTRTFSLLTGEDGRGLLIESLWWQADIPPLPFPPTQPATLQIRDTAGAVLAQQNLTVVSWDDTANISQVTVYFLLGEDLQSVIVNVPKTVRVGTAALEELLWGPPPPNLAGFTTALPLPAEVLSYPGRGPDWGPRVRLLDLKIESGVATANFSRELKAYGGGSTRVMLIAEQITRTLKEFPSVQQVVIAVEGQTEGVLEP